MQKLIGLALFATSFFVKSSLGVAVASVMGTLGFLILLSAFLGPKSRRDTAKESVCPNCAEIIMADAKRCRYCNTTLG